MGKLKRKETILFLAGFFCLVLFRPAFSQEVVVGQAMTVEQLTADINQKWGNIQDFQSNLTVGMRISGKMAKIEGVLWQKERFFRTEMTVPPEIMEVGTGYRMPGLVKALMVFDGKIMWFSLPEMNMVMKADISALGRKTNNAPFSKPVYSLPVTSYQLSEKMRKGIDYYFLETKDINKFVQNSPAASMGLNLPKNISFQSVGVWVNKATLFPDLVEFYDQKSTPVMYVEFKDVKTDQGLSPKLFVLKVPEGVTPMDMTETLKAMAGKAGKQSTASDTIQATTAPDTAQASQ